MHPHERLEVARDAYRRAIALARQRPTPSSWRRALTASWNLADAKRDRDRLRDPLRGGTTSRRPAGSPPRTPGRPAAAARPSARERWPELAAQCDRARALMERSRALVEQARALSDEIARIAGWRILGPSA